MEILFSLHPVNAGCSLIETSQIENKYDYDTNRNDIGFSLLEVWDPLWRPFGADAPAKRPSPHHTTAWAHTSS